MSRHGSAAICDPKWNVGSSNMGLLSQTYYAVKPFLPDSLRMFLRRAWASRQRRANGAVWPINPAASCAPKDWPGWPDGKRFAFVLTHDVESQRGVGRSESLAEMEKAAGFRSSFNFIPEGEYETPAELRAWLQSNGFEVGVHDLRHDGKLYWSRKAFRRHAVAINRYMKNWGAVGFRSGFMLRNLEWLSDVEMLYDSSTFDTDPFEPQPEGTHTIFPFWVPSSSGSGKEGYVELPYTLAQDFTLFVVLREQTDRVWKQKLDWIAERGGMALMNTHPDYMSFEGITQRDEFKVDLYLNFLEYVKKNYAGAFWHPLPCELASWVSRAQHTSGVPA
jgi:hypothetical protein